MGEQSDDQTKPTDAYTRPSQVRRKLHKPRVTHWLAIGESAEVIAHELGIPIPTSSTSGANVLPRRTPTGRAQRPNRGRSPISRHNSTPPIANWLACASNATVLKNVGHPLRSPARRYQRIDAMKCDNPIQTLCAAFDVSASGYYDNAAMDSSWSTLKLELVYRRVFQTRGQARQEIFDFIESFYNRQRLHSALGYLSPVDFETQNTNPMPRSHSPIFEASPDGSRS